RDLARLLNQRQVSPGGGPPLRAVSLGGWMLGSRHSLAGAGCSTTGELSLALAARPPGSSRWRSLLDHRGALAGARCSTTRELSLALAARPQESWRASSAAVSQGRRTGEHGADHA